MSKIYKIEGSIEISHDLYNRICDSLMVPGDVATELSELPAKFSYYHGIMVRAKRLLDDVVDRYEHYKSTTCNEKRKEGKSTVAAIEDFVNSLDDTVNLNNEVQNRQEIYGYAKGICSSLEMKKDMLVQLSANSRQETKLYQ